MFGKTNFDAFFSIGNPCMVPQSSCAEIGRACAEIGGACAEIGSACAEIGGACAEIGMPCAEIWGLVRNFNLDN